VARDEFVELIDDLLTRTITSVDKALADTNLKPTDIDRVLLVGGSTRIPAVWDMVSARMEQEPHIEIDPDAAVALGASVQAGIIAGEKIDTILVDVTPLSLGIEVADFGASRPDGAEHRADRAELPPPVRASNRGTGSTLLILRRMTHAYL